MFVALSNAKSDISKACIPTNTKAACHFQLVASHNYLVCYLAQKMKTKPKARRLVKVMTLCLSHVNGEIPIHITDCVYKAVIITA